MQQGAGPTASIALVVVVLVSGCLWADGPADRPEVGELVGDEPDDRGSGAGAGSDPGGGNATGDGTASDGNATPQPRAWRALGPTNVINWRGDVQRSGHVPNVSVPDAVGLAWRLDDMNQGEHTAAKGSAVVVNGTILVGTDTGTLFALGVDGTELWRAQTEPSRNGIHGTPSVAGGLVFIGAYDGAMYAYDLDTGDLVWRTRIGDSIGSSPLHYGGRIFVSVETREPSGIMAVLDAATGAEIWRDERITDHPHSSVALDPFTGVFVVGANDGVLYAWDLATYEYLWSYETGDAIKGPIMVHNASAYFGSWDHHVYRIDLRTGRPLWVYGTGADVMSGAAYDPATDQVFIGSHDRYVYALDADDGTFRWRYKTGGRVTSSPVVAGDTVLVGSYDEHLYALDTRTGDPRWLFDTNGQLTSSALVWDDRVAVLDRADEGHGSLWVLGPAGPT